MVHRNTISRFFLNAFPHRGGLCRPCLVPFDKFRPCNAERAVEYIDFLSCLDPRRVKFGDEKHLKSGEVFTRKSRRHVITGEVPFMMALPDFTNRYTLTGFCSIDPRTPAVWCSIHESTNDADQFALELEYAIQSRFLLAGDVLVLDNAQIHSGRENSVLEDYLWRNYGIFLLFLPARCPEWNPQEQVWRHLVMNLRQYPLNAIRCMGGEHATA